MSLVSRLSFRAALLAVATLMLVCCTYLSSAQAQDSRSGIGITPSVIDETRVIQPGETLNKSLTITNLSGTDQTYYLFVRNIEGTEGNGVPIFSEDDAELTGYELSEWVTLSTTEISLAAGENAQVQASIAVPQNAIPGSHFGGIFVSMEPPRLRETGAAIGYQVASIVHIRVDGEVEEHGTIRSFSTGNYIYGGLDIDFLARIENAGNTLIRPYGPLEIMNMFGSTVATLTFNESLGGVFPGETRDFEFNWEGEGPGFGRYTAQLSLVYGPQGRQQTMSNTVTFWVLPMQIIMPALGVLAVLLLTVFISVKLYIRSQLRGVAGFSRRVSARRRSAGPSAFLLVTLSMLVVTALFLVVLLLLFA